MGFGLFGLHGPSGSKLLLNPMPGHIVYGLCVAGWVVPLQRVLAPTS